MPVNPDEQQDYINAIKEAPEGRVCVWCNEDNDFVDDCGWFYLFGKFPCCKSCWKGRPGKAHISKYGLGER